MVGDARLGLLSAPAGLFIGKRRTDRHQPARRARIAGAQQPDDVRTIQDALNRVTVANAAGGPMPFLAVDGICGPKTNATISLPAGAAEDLRRQPPFVESRPGGLAGAR